ncbi:MAG: hypothetical protein FJ303_20250 [Planctomycetes bacterium]|nr:hypothetical protein [Planctomycetota bacterium]
MISRQWWLGLLGLVWFALSGDALAWDRPPVKVNTQFQFRVEVKVGPYSDRPTAPWYAYFPADARMLTTTVTNPYPTWPMHYPPQGPSTDVRKMSGSAPIPQGPMLTQHWPGYYAPGSLQPVGFVPTQAPSYWYQGR